MNSIKTSTFSLTSSREYAAYIGIDWADRKHDICLYDPATGAWEPSVIAHTPDAIKAWVESLRQRFTGQRLAIATELKRGPAGVIMTRLHQRRLVAVLGTIDDLKSRLWLEALRQGINTVPQVVWISDGARGFWRLYRECFAHCAIGILDFYHAAQHLWQAASAYHNGNPTRTPQIWFARMRHQLRHGFGKRIIKELDWLSKSKNTAQATKPILRQVRDYLKTHINHIQYRSFKKQGLPIGSGMVESACKWLIGQRFKGTGMRWSKDGFNHLLHLRLAWVNNRFDTLFSEESLELTLYSPNR